MLSEASIASAAKRAHPLDMSRFIVVFAALWFAVAYFPRQTAATCEAIHHVASAAIDSVWAAPPLTATDEAVKPR